MADHDRENEIKTKVSNEKYSVLVHLLDGNNLILNFNDFTTGFQLLRQLCNQLDVKEYNYFGLWWLNSSDTRCWLDMEKPAKKKLKGKVLKSGINFAVKFFHSDPAQIEDPNSRHQIVLQIRKLIAEGSLSCSFVTQALLGSFVVQYELGTYDQSTMIDNYVKKFKFASDQTTELENRIIELHQTIKSQTPIEAEINFLENARKLPFYGVDLHPAKDSDHVNLSVGICWSGILVFRDQVRINRFAWPRIVKITYARTKFSVRIRPLDGDSHDSVVSFKLPSITAAKNLWMVCMQHHQFFRVN